MAVRLLLTDEAWAEIAPILAAIKSRAGSPPALSDRMFIEAVLYLGYVRDTCKKVSQQPHGVVAKSRRSISRSL